MPRLSLTDLPWLPRTGADFRAELRSVEQNEVGEWGSRLRSLSNQYLGLNQAIALARTLELLRARSPSSSLSTFRLGLVSNAAMDFLKPLLVASALRYGIALEIIAADFGQIMQEAIDPASLINTSKPDAVLLAVDHRGFPVRTASPGWPLFDPLAAIDELRVVRDALRRNCGALSLVQTLPAPMGLLFGSLDVGTSGTLRSTVAAINLHLARDVPERGDVLVDIEWLANAIGLDEWYDDRHWHMARMPCAQKALPLYAEFVARCLAAIRGKSRKCLILDLDNTLWGGVIGDDGLEGIAINPGDARGEAFRAIQAAALDLRNRGVVLAVCSKNEDAIARTPFRSHGGMLLKEDDIAVFMANWDDKATNIERIAQRLELGLDAMVLLDDNPAERAQVRQALPQVAVPELGDDPSSYPRLLQAAGYFESVAFTREDIHRAGEYKSNADRVLVMESSRNLDEFLRSLEMQIRFTPFDAVGRKRVTQLINKTNQFNVTTRRYTEQQIATLENSKDHFALQVSVSDRFGDNGMISVVICIVQGTQWVIDTWLMSCRVLNRRVEEAVCNHLAAEAKRAGARGLLGEFIPTERNKIVGDLYSRLGFTAGTQEGQWVLDLDSFTPFEIVAKQIVDAPQTRPKSTDASVA